MDKHALALISIIGSSLDVLGALYLAYDLLGGEHGPLRTLTREGQLASFRHNGFWQAMDTLRDRNQLEQLWDSGHAPWRVWK